MIYVIYDNYHDEILGATSDLFRAWAYVKKELAEIFDYTPEEVNKEIANMKDEDYCEDTIFSILEIPII